MARSCSFLLLLLLLPPEPGATLSLLRYRYDCGDHGMQLLAYPSPGHTVRFKVMDEFGARFDVANCSICLHWLHAGEDGAIVFSSGYDGCHVLVKEDRYVLRVQLEELLLSGAPAASYDVNVTCPQSGDEGTLAAGAERAEHRAGRGNSVHQTQRDVLVPLAQPGLLHHVSQSTLALPGPQVDSEQVHPVAQTQPVLVHPGFQPQPDTVHPGLQSHQGVMLPGVHPQNQPGLLHPRAQPQNHPRMLHPRAQPQPGLLRPGLQPQNHPGMLHPGAQPQNHPGMLHPWAQTQPGLLRPGAQPQNRPGMLLPGTQTQPGLLRPGIQPQNRPGMLHPGAQPQNRPGMLLPGTQTQPGLLRPGIQLQNGPGMLHPGAQTPPGLLRPGLQPQNRPGMLHPGAQPQNRPGMLHPGAQPQNGPGMLHPGAQPQNRPGMLHPGAIPQNRLLRPGLQPQNRPGMLHPGAQTQPGLFHLGVQPQNRPGSASRLTHAGAQTHAGFVRPAQPQSQPGSARPSFHTHSQGGLLRPGLQSQTGLVHPGPGLLSQPGLVRPGPQAQLQPGLVHPGLQPQAQPGLLRPGLHSQPSLLQSAALFYPSAGAGTQLTQEQCQVAVGRLPCVAAQGREACLQAGCCYDDTDRAAPCYYGNTGRGARPGHPTPWPGAQAPLDGVALPPHTPPPVPDLLPLHMEVAVPPTATPLAMPGPLGLQLRIATDETYSSYHSDGASPLVRVLRDPIHVEVRLLQKTDPNLVLVLHQCWAAPSPEPTAEPWWPILVDGCPFEGDNYRTRLVPVGPATPQLPFPSHYQRFVISTFAFVEPTPSTAVLEGEV
ncbi:ZP1 protein, partial [Rhynochetos jubatus]|nr:ZP1 protein [Rhynochetos jubatus]